jgi:hypothetical protein
VTGVDKALANSDIGEFAAFLEVIEGLPAGHAFRIEDVIDNDHYGLPVDHPNRIGAWTQAAHRRGLIERVSYAPARKSSRNGAVVAVWRRCSKGAQ